MKMISKAIRSFWRSDAASSLTTSAAIIAAASLVSRVLGVVRDRVLASTFGAGDVLDAYYAAFRLPDLLYNLLVVGALSAGFIPVFIAYRQKRRGDVDDDHWLLVNQFLTVAITTLGAGCALFAIFAPHVVPLITPGFHGEKLELVIMLSRIMFLSPILLGVSAIVGGILQSYRQFVMYSLAPMLYNLGIIFGVFFLVPRFGVTGLAWGVVLGALGHLVLQFFSARRLGWKPKLLITWNHPGLKQIGKLMVPNTLSLSVTQLNIFVLTILASGLESGSLAIFTLATNLVSVPMAIVGVSYALAAFPVLSEHAAKGEVVEFRQVFSRTVRRIVFLIVPATVLLLLLRAQIVRVIFGAGAFTWHDTILTLNVVGFLTVSLFAQALAPLLIRTFYTHHKTWPPFIIGVLSDGIIVLASIFIGIHYGVVGLAAAFSFGMIVKVIGLWLLLHWKFGDMGEGIVVRGLWQFTLAAMAMVAVVQGGKMLVGNMLGTNTALSVFLQGVIAGGLGLIVYGMILYLLKSEEMMEFGKVLSKRLGKLPLSQLAKEGLDQG